MRKHTFIENGEDRQATAALLVTAAEDADISRRDILPTGKGFWISETLADVLVEEGILSAEEPEQDPEVPSEDTEDPDVPTEDTEDTKTSGNRAAKKKKTPKE